MRVFRSFCKDIFAVISTWASGSSCGTAEIETIPLLNSRELY